MYRIDEMIILRKQGLTLQKIGDKFNLSRERIRQLIPRIPLHMYQPGYRRCYQCKIVLPFSDFYISRSKKRSTNNRCKKCLKKNSLKWSKKYRYKYKKGGKYYQQTLARSAIRLAISSNKIIKPTICEINKNCEGRIEGHHYAGYDEPNYYKIRWLCSKHHELADKGLI